MTDTWKWTAQSKLCFVTTGATAPFTALIESVLSAQSLETLIANGFTHLLVQYGTANDIFVQYSTAARTHLEQSAQTAGQLVIDGIDFDSNGLDSQFKLVQKSKGLVISHAGTVPANVSQATVTNSSQVQVPFWRHCDTKSHS
jgi:beta-1,4-N-acetylglucosaminyltransferase